MCVVTLPFTIFYRVKKSTCCNVVDKVVCCNSAFGSCVLRSFSHSHSPLSFPIRSKENQDMLWQCERHQVCMVQICAVYYKVKACSKLVTMFFFLHFHVYHFLFFTRNNVLIPLNPV